MQRNKGKQMEKTRNLFKKTGDTKGTFHSKMGTVKYRYDEDLLATRLEKVSFHSNPNKSNAKKKMLKHLYNCPHFTYK